MARNNPTISHLLLADDNIIFSRASIDDWNETQNIIDTYEAASGQGVNKHKSNIFFSANTHPNFRGNILNIAGVSLYTNQDKYLGLPMMVGRNRSRTFVAVRDRV